MSSAEREATLWSGTAALRIQWPLWLPAVAALALGGALYVHGAGRWTLASPAAAALLAGAAWLRSRSSRYVLTSQRVIATAGLLARARVEIELSDIRQMGLVQSLGQRMLGVGTIEIESAGGEGVQLRIASVAGPAALLELIRQARLGRGGADAGRA